MNGVTLRRFRSTLILAFAGLLLAILAWRMMVQPAAAQSSPQVVHATASTKASLKPAEAALPPSLPPGSTLYVAKHGDSVASVAHHFIGQSSLLTSSELAEAIRHANGGLTGTFLKSDSS